MKKFTLKFLLIDFFVITVSFLFFIWLKPASLRQYLPQYYPYYIYITLVWISLSILSGKFAFHKKTTLDDFLFPVITSTTLILVVVIAGITILHKVYFSRLIVFGTILLTTFLELNLVTLYYYYRKLNRHSDFFSNLEESFYASLQTDLSSKETETHEAGPTEFTEYPLSYFKDLITEKTEPEVYHSIIQHLDPSLNHTHILATAKSFNINAIQPDSCRNIINLSPINDIKRVNKFFEAVNNKLPNGGIYINSVKTNEIKKREIYTKQAPVFNHFYYFIYFIFRRVFPKLPIIKKTYFFFTDGFDRAISKAETFGRLYSCGFELVDEFQTNNLLYFVARKIKSPVFDYNATYGPLISLKRIGENGKIIRVYKFRTMYPYSEYLQEYVYKMNALQEGGKFKNDFRISTTGNFMRKFWLDELPMIFNLLKGDLKLVGVRPISPHYFSLYTPELQQLRSKHRPGLIPPYYADMPKTLDEIMASEINYLNASEKHPFKTDCNYFWRAIYNIVIKRKRSN